MHSTTAKKHVPRRVDMHSHVPFLNEASSSTQTRPISGTINTLCIDPATSNTLPVMWVNKTMFHILVQSGDTVGGPAINTDTRYGIAFSAVCHCKMRE